MDWAKPPRWCWRYGHWIVGIFPESGDLMRRGVIAEWLVSKEQGFIVLRRIGTKPYRGNWRSIGKHFSLDLSSKSS